MKSKDLLKRIIIVTVVAVLAIGICLVGGCRPAPEVAPPEVAEELPTYRWRVQSIFPPAQNVDFERPWLDQLEEALAGRANVTFELYGSGELMPDDQIISALQAGTIDFTHATTLVVAPYIDIADFASMVPFAWQSASEAMVLFNRKGLEEIFAEAYDELGGVKYLGLTPCDPGHLISTKPVRNYEDLKGLKMNAFKTVAQPFEEAGAVSIVLPPEEFYLSGKTGVVDALIWGGSKECYSNGWHEVYSYFVTNPINIGISFWMVRSELWDSLPSDIQEIISLAVDAAALQQLTYYHEGEAATRKYMGELITWSDEDMAKLRESTMRYWDEVAKTSPRCAQVVKIIKDYNAEVEAAEWYR